MSLKVWGKVAGIVCLGVILDIVAHRLAPQTTAAAQSGSSGAIVLSPSVIVRLGLFVPAFLIFGFVAFGLLAVVFITLQANLPQSHWIKGFWYGSAFGGLWFIGMLEASLVLGTPLEHELIMGAADALPILIMGVLLGAFVGTTQHAQSRKARAAAIAIPGIALNYMVGRYFAYEMLRIDSAYATHPLGTFLWTLGMGVWIGIIYWLLAPGLRSISPLKRAVVFSCLVFGSDWFMFTFFLPLLFEMNLGDLLMRFTVDVLSVMIGVFAVERLIERRILMPAKSGMKVLDQNRVA